MNLEKLQERKSLLEASLQNIQQSFHIVTGHIQEVAYQIQELEKAIEDSPVTEDVANLVETIVQ